MLKHVARALFLSTGFFALQASALLSAACALPAHHSLGTVQIAVEQGDTAGMSGMAMSSTDSDRGMIAKETPAPRSPATPGDGPCDHATAPQDCAAMTVCSTVFISSPGAPHEVGALPARIAVTTDAAPSSLVIPPVSPPPRA